MSRLGSTYRLQLNGFGFARAAELVPYLHDLGVETAYLSPIASAQPSSTHGYDVIDPTTVDPELGGAEGLERLLSALAAHGMSALIDIVPNHVAAVPANPYFADVLLHGRASPFADWFDISWERADGRIVLPVLDGSVREELERGNLRVERDPATGRLAFRAAGAFYPACGGDADDESLLADLAGADPRSEPAARREMELLLAHQHYLLVDWRSANETVNYRRFFAINELIGVRQEDPKVFAATHTLVAELARDGRVAGFRVDHVDGLRDPDGYLHRLRDLVDAGGAHRVILVEKILARDEALADWPVEGTTGYEAAGAITGVLVDADGAAAIAAEDAESSGDDRSFRARAVSAKQSAARTMLSGAVDAVLRQLRSAGIAADEGTLRVAVETLSAELEVYRTYRTAADSMPPAEVDRVRAAAQAAQTQLGPAAQATVAAIVEVLTGPRGAAGAGAAAVAGWQQLTPGVVAKGVEDTALFDAGQLLALCDVGVEPSDGTWTVEDWHGWMARRQQRWPAAMTAGSTHDSKRSLDVRCRLAVLSELANWPEAVRQLDALLASTEIGAAARRYLYQTCVAVWPLEGSPDAARVDRIREHLVKAAREAAVHTTWNAPDAEYETAYQDLVLKLADGAAKDVVGDLVGAVALPGAANSLAAVVLGATAPGVPDVYQGDEVWSFALTDPDNRRPVDWERQSNEGKSTDVAALVADWRSGRIKRHVLRSCLQLRRELGQWWEQAGYEPLVSSGPAAEHVIGFRRTHGDRTVATVVPRLPLTLAGSDRFPTGDVWGDTAVALAGDGWRNALTGQPVAGDTGVMSLRKLLDPLPVAVLVR